MSSAFSSANVGACRPPCRENDAASNTCCSMVSVPFFCRCTETLETPSSISLAAIGAFFRRCGLIQSLPRWW